jgi:hypothetical protein
MTASKLAAIEECAAEFTTSCHIFFVSRPGDVKFTIKDFEDGLEQSNGIESGIGESLLSRPGQMRNFWLQSGAFMMRKC